MNDRDRCEAWCSSWFHIMHILLALLPEGTIEASSSPSTQTQEILLFWVNTAFSYYCSHLSTSETPIHYLGTLTLCSYAPLNSVASCYSGVLQRNKTNRIQRYRERDFKDLAHTIVGASKSKICRAGQQAGNSGRIPRCRFEAELPFL